MIPEHGPPTPDQQGESPDFRHVYPLLALVIGGAIAALTVRALLVPDSFGDFGYYRGDAVAAAREKPVRHVGETACRECHDEEAGLHDKDVHVSVPCETCHGPGAEHAAAEGEGHIIVPKGKEPCLTCHRRLTARPGAFPQIRWREHYEFVGVKDDTVVCTQCHNPHEPLFMDRDIHQARLHPIVHRCRDCHADRSDENLVQPKTHPQIFECSYCHKEIAADFATRPHHVVRCGTCHLFVRENEFSGRIIRDADPRFCLLCHRDAPFRSDSAPPGITWPEHRTDMAEGPEDQEKRCIDCHADRIHVVSKEAPHAP